MVPAVIHPVLAAGATRVGVTDGSALHAGITCRMNAASRGKRAWKRRLLVGREKLARVDDVLETAPGQIFPCRVHRSPAKGAWETQPSTLISKVSMTFAASANVGRISDRELHDLRPDSFERFRREQQRGVEIAGGEKRRHAITVAQPGLVERPRREGDSGVPFFRRTVGEFRNVPEVPLLFRTNPSGCVSVRISRRSCDRAQASTHPGRARADRPVPALSGKVSYSRVGNNGEFRRAWADDFRQRIRTSQEFWT